MPSIKYIKNIDTSVNNIIKSNIHVSNLGQPMN